MLNNKTFFAFVLLLSPVLLAAQKAPKHLVKAAQAATTSASTLLPEQILEKELHSLRLPSGQVLHKAKIRSTQPSFRHSLYPSQALSIVQSEALPNRKVLSFADLASKYKIENTLTKNYINKKEANRWRQVREELNLLWSQMPPISLGNLPCFLRHPVPPETMKYLRETYVAVVEKSKQTRSLIFPWIIYASFPGEGRSLLPEEREKFNTEIISILHDIRALRSSLSTDPYLEKQEDFWLTMLTRFNPLLESILRQQNHHLTRTDRVLKKEEFNLLNPDGSDYLLPKSETLIGDEDEIEELDSYRAVREKMLNPPITQEAAAIEREELLKQIPSGMHIAFINDDYLPRLNFDQWGKKGFLGKDATIEVFSDGFNFMNKVREGVEYDLVITDLLVAHAGLVMMPELRKISPNTVVIACSKYDRGEEPEERLYNAGMDGYLWYNTNLNEGAYGYIEYLRALKNYFYYKNLHHWKR